MIGRSRGGGFVSALMIAMLVIACDKNPTEPATAPKQTVQADVSGPCIWWNARWVCQYDKHFVDGGKSALPLTPQFMTAGHWCPIMSPDGQVWWVWFEDNHSCPPFHPPGSDRKSDTTRSPFMSPVAQTLTGNEQPPSQCVPWIEYLGTDEQGNPVPFAWHTCWHIILNGRSTGGRLGSL